MGQGGARCSVGGFSVSSQDPFSCSGNYCLALVGCGCLSLALTWSLLAPCRVPTVPVKNLTGSSPVNPALAGEDGAAAGRPVPTGAGLHGWQVSPSGLVWGEHLGFGVTLVP